MRKNVLILIILFFGIVFRLFAQVSASDYLIHESFHLGTAPDLTLDDASRLANVIFTNSANKAAQQNGFTHRVIHEKTRMEEQLVARARRELPDKPSIGSIWSVIMGHVTGVSFVDMYHIIFFCKSR